MSVITRAEVKKILRLDNEEQSVDSTSITLSSLERHRLGYKGSLTIQQVRASTVNTTLSSVNAIYTSTDYYTTKDYAGYTLIRRRPSSESTEIAEGATVYVSYTYNDYDDLIDYLIPIVEKDLCGYLNNYFEDANTYVTLGSYKFIEKTSSTAGQLTDTYNQQFLDYGFTDTMQIVVRGTHRNSGIYDLSSATASRLLIGSTEDFTEESSTEFYSKGTIQVSRLRWPEAIKPYVAYIIWNNIERSRNMSITSRTLGQNNITYESLSSGVYPPSIMNGLKRFKNVETT